MTERVVDRAETVEVDEQDADRLVGAFADREGVGHPVEQQRPVRQAGELVVERLLDEALLGLALLGDVPARRLELTDVALGGQDRRDHRLEPAERPVAVAQPVAEPGGLRATAAGVVDGLDERVAGARVGEVDRMGAEQRRRVEVEQAAARGRHVGERATRVVEADQIRGVLGDGPEDVLGGGQRLGRRRDQRVGLPRVGEPPQLDEQERRAAGRVDDRSERDASGSGSGAPDVDGALTGPALDAGLHQGGQRRRRIVVGPDRRGPQGPAPNRRTRDAETLGAGVDLEDGAVEIDQQGRPGQAVEGVAPAEGPVQIIGFRVGDPSQTREHVGAGSVAGHGRGFALVGHALAPASVGTPARRQRYAARACPSRMVVTRGVRNPHARWWYPSRALSRGCVCRRAGSADFGCDEHAD